MASISPEVLKSLDQLSGMSQVILLINNIKGINENERLAIKNLAFQRDQRLFPPIEQFKRDQNLQRLLRDWQSLLASETHHTAANYFSAMDLKRRGFLTQPDIEKYLTEVYAQQVTNNPRLQGVNSAEHAVRKATDIFRRIDTDHDGRISYQEFEWWFNQNGENFVNIPPEITRSQSLVSQHSRKGSQGEKPSLLHSATLKPLFRNSMGEVVQAVVPAMDLIKLRDELGLGQVSATTIVGQIKALLKSKDYLTQSEFHQMLINSAGQRLQGFALARFEQVSGELFKMLDVSGDGRLDREEILNSTIIFAGGDPDDKMRALFMLYDVDGDGLLTFNELLKHQTAVFKIMFATQSEFMSQCKETPENLARVTTESIFQQIDLNNDLVITYDEFRCWFNKEEASDDMRRDKKKRLKAYGDKLQLLKAELEDTVNSLTSDEAYESLQEIRKYCGLSMVHVEDAVEIFKKNDVSGYFSRMPFFDTLNEIVNTYGNPEVLSKTSYQEFSTKLFNMFDRDRNGVVDLGELFCGLSLVCSGNSTEKLAAAFNLFDHSGDGIIQYTELTHYFKAIFQVLFSGIKSAGTRINSDDFAHAAADNAFKQFSQGKEEGGLTFEQLKLWHDSTEFRYL